MVRDRYDFPCIPTSLDLIKDIIPKIEAVPPAIFTHKRTNECLYLTSNNIAIKLTVTIDKNINKRSWCSVDLCSICFFDDKGFPCY